MIADAARLVFDIAAGHCDFAAGQPQPGSQQLQGEGQLGVMQPCFEDQTTK